MKQIIESGDVSLNPGPVKYPCCMCGKAVAKTHRAIQCASCDKWCHIGERCGKVKLLDYQKFTKDATNNLKWYCPLCKTQENTLGCPPSLGPLHNHQQQQQEVESRPSTNPVESPEYEFTYSKLLQEIQGFGKANLKIGHVNVNGLMTLSKLQEIKLLLSTTKFDIMGITETKFTGTIKDEELDINGYKFVRKDRRDEDGGGGCMLYYQESLDVTENIKLFPAELDTLEAIWVEFKLHSQRLLLSVMYRSQKHVDIYETLDKQLEYIWEKRKNIHIIGDLNSDLLLKSKSEEQTTYGRKLLKALRNYGLVNVIKQPTRVTASTKSHIDLSIVSEKEKVLKSGVFETGIADLRLN